MEDSHPARVRRGHGLRCGATELGVLAVQLVMDPPDDSPTHIEVPTRVVLRASTGG